MVKVIIEEDSGERRELTGDFTFVTVASGKESGYGISNYVLGKCNKNQIPYLLAHAVFDDMCSIYESEELAECISRLVEFKNHIVDLIMGKITENKDALNLTDEMNFFLALIAYMEKEENNGN